MTLHPILLAARSRTERWWKHREKCKTCGHVSKTKHGAMLCGAVVDARPGGLLPCIDARDVGGECGPEGRLWRAR